MARRILIPLLIAPAAFCFQNIEPGCLDAASQAALAVAGAAGQDDDFACGECPWPEPEDRGGHEAAVSSAVSLDEHAVPRRPPSDPPGHGPGPVLCSLCECLILSRPPPAVSVGAWRTLGDS